MENQVIFDYKTLFYYNFLCLNNVSFHNSHKTAAATDIHTHHITNKMTKNVGKIIFVIDGVIC